MSEDTPRYELKNFGNSRIYVANGYYTLAELKDMVARFEKLDADLKRSLERSLIPNNKD